MRAASPRFSGFVMNEVQQNRRPGVFLEGARGNLFLQKMVSPHTNKLISENIH